MGKGREVLGGRGMALDQDQLSRLSFGLFVCLPAFFWPRNDDKPAQAR